MTAIRSAELCMTPVPTSNWLGLWQHVSAFVAVGLAVADFLSLETIRY